MASTLRLILLENANDGIGEAFKWYSSGAGTLQVFGVWDGATVTLQGRSSDANEWTSLSSGGEFTEDYLTWFEAGQIEIRAVISGGGGFTSLTLYLTPTSRGLS